MKRNNCFWFSFCAWLRWKDKGAYWAVRKSRHIGGWHWLVNYKGRWIHYEPEEPKEQAIKAAVHKIWYKGHIRRDDALPEKRKKGL